jgi:hypothetical protein
VSEELPKNRWGEGPWQNEPDRLEWTDQETGLHCLIIRTNISGSLCGYVGVEPSHPAHGLDYDGSPHEEAKEYYKALRESMRKSVRNSKLESPKLEAPEPVSGIGNSLGSIRVHGGLTYAGLRGEFDRGLWYFGFDCGHYDDFMPALEARLKLLYVDESMAWKKRSPYNGTYRDIDYVKNECQKLARQLKAMDNVKVPVFTSEGTHD